MMRLQFNGLWPWWLVLIVGIMGSVAIARWYYRESRYTKKPMRWLLPLLRALAFLLIMLMLAGPTLIHRTIEGELSRIRIVVDRSLSMATCDEPFQLGPDETERAVDNRRIDHVARWLIGDDRSSSSKRGIIERLRQSHRVDLFTTKPGELHANERATELLWDSLSEATLPKAEAMQANGVRSPLGNTMAESLNDHPAAVLLISDGQSNAGLSLSDASNLAKTEQVPVFTIGVGSTEEPVDFGIVEVEHSQRVFRTDRLRGTIAIKEQMAQGTPYRIVLKHLDRIVWSGDLRSQHQGLRRVDFDLPAESLVNTSKIEQKGGANDTCVPIDLRFSIESDAAEVAFDNNEFNTSLWGVDRKNRVLILDRRGGWETRYIKNALERDVAWQSTVVIGPAAFGTEFFPATRSALFDYDLVLLTLESYSQIKKEYRPWLSDFVSTSGGGLIVIDSNRPITDSADEELASLLPVELLAGKPSEIKQLELSSAAVDQPAFRLGSSPELNLQLWKELTFPRSFRHAKALPGAEVLLVGVDKAENSQLHPLVATKLIGQGRVVYMANDETWRWRYNVADLYHQRFWNQLATWSMRAPFAINDSFASLDTGPRMVTASESITIRAKLNFDGSLPADNVSVQAVLERDGVRQGTFPMPQESDARGFYRTTIGPFPPGEYTVRLEATGIPQDALQITSKFLVQQPAELETESLACNAEGLEQVANATGGEFVMLDQADSIIDKLKKFQTGKIIESRTLLWQSYPWFVTIMLLLAAEWYLRKRAGLV